METFKKLHFYRSKQNFTAKPLAEGMQLIKVQPDMNTVLRLIERVGCPYGWDRRKEYFYEKEKLQARINHPTSRLYGFAEGKQLVGFCFQSPTVENFHHVFDGKTPNYMHSATEIEKFGLFPEATGRGLGHMFLGAVLTDIFSRFPGVYLSTRDTNHSKVPEFYLKNGFSLAKTEDMPSDLLDVSVTTTLDDREAEALRAQA